MWGNLSILYWMRMGEIDLVGFASVIEVADFLILASSVLASDFVA